MLQLCCGLKGLGPKKWCEGMGVPLIEIGDVR